MSNRDTLKKVYLFEDLTNEELDRVLSIANKETHESETVIFKEGDPGEKFYILLDGEVRVMKPVASLGNEALAILKPGDFFGEMALIDDSPRSATIIVNGKTTLLAIRKADFESLLFLNKELAYTLLWAFVRTLSARLRETNDKLSNFLTMANSGF